MWQSEPTAPKCLSPLPYLLLKDSLVRKFSFAGASFVYQTMYALSRRFINGWSMSWSRASCYASSAHPSKQLSPFDMGLLHIPILAQIRLRAPSLTQSRERRRRSVRHWRVYDLPKHPVATSLILMMPYGRLCHTEQIMYRSYVMSAPPRES